MYVFLAVAPCTFSIGGKQYKLSAGSTFTISKELGEQLRGNTFPYRKHLRLMSEIQEEPVTVAVESVVVEPVTISEPSLEVSPKLESKLESKEEVEEDKPSFKSKRTIKKLEV